MTEETKKKILLIYPPSPVMNREDRCQQPTKELLVIPPLPPSDLMYLAAVSEKAGLEAIIRDYSAEGNFEQDLVEIQPDYLLLNVATPTLENDLAVCETAKKICPSIVTIAKGAAFLTVAFDVMYAHKNLDIAILGEAEKTLEEILSGKPYPEILGIYYRDDFMVKFTGARRLLKTLMKFLFQPVIWWIITNLEDRIMTRFRR